MHVFVFISTRSERYSYINTLQEHHCVVRDGKRSFKNSRHFKQNHFELNVLIPVEYNILPSLYNFLLIFRIISSYRRQWIRLSGKINMSTIINITCQPLSTLHVNHYQHYMSTIININEPVIAEIPPALDWSIYLARLRVMLDSGNAFSSNVLLNIPTDMSFQVYF